MKELLVIVEITNTGYSAYVPLLPGCITVGDTYDEIKLNIKEAIALYIEDMEEDGEVVPDFLKKEYGICLRVDVRELFEHFKGILTKSALSKITGINSSLISQYVMGIKHPSEKQAKKIEKALHELGQEFLSVRL
jgi:predicted RNase H-like HicB family nuclease